MTACRTWVSDRFGLVDDPVVAGQGRQLVHRPPGHVDRHEVPMGQRRADQGPDVTQVAASSQGAADELVARGSRRIRGVVGHALRIGGDLDARLTEQPAERLAVPELLVVPTGEKRGHVGLEGRVRGQNVSEENYRVRLDVHHVAKCPSLVGGQRMLRHAIPLDAGQVDATGGSDEAIQIEFARLHGHSSLRAGRALRRARPEQIRA